MTIDDQHLISTPVHDLTDDDLRPKDYYDLHADLQKTLGEIMNDLDVVLDGYNVPEPELLAFLEVLNTLLDYIKDVSYEIDTMREEQDYQKKIDEIRQQDENPLLTLWALTQHHAKTVDNSCEIALAREQLVLGWAKTSWAIARNSELEIGAAGLSNFNRAELRQVYNCARTINLFLEKYEITEDDSKALSLIGSTLRDINRVYVERTRAEYRAMQTLSLFRPRS